MSPDSDGSRNRLSDADKGLMRHQRLRLAVVNMAVLLFIWSILSVFVYFVLQDETVRAEHTRLAFFAEQLADQAYHREGYAPKRLHPSDEDVMYAIWQRKGTSYHLIQSVMNSNTLLHSLKPIANTNNKLLVFSDVFFQGEHYQMYVNHYLIHGSYTVIQVLDDVGPEEGVLRHLAILFVIGGVIGLGLSIAGAYLLGRWTLRPLTEARLREQEFVADVSHELRTPLSVLQTHLELLLRHVDTENQTILSDIEPIYKETKRMRRLVEDLLDLARMDAGVVSNKSEQYSLSELCSEVVELYDPLFQQKSVHFSHDISANVKLIGDSGRMRQLLFILLDNAYKYTEHGEVKLQALTNSHSIDLIVSDTGIGIAQDWLPRVTERFVRGEYSRTRESINSTTNENASTTVSSGLGLAIAKRIVMSMQGKWHLQSEVGIGTTVTIRLPNSLL